jgi:catechol 2,3-dioxygenase-like lactoylglutathione lyase family enzyme
MTVTSLYPVLLSTDPERSGAFFRDWFGLQTTFAADWYVSLRTGSWDLAMVEASHPTVPDGYREPARGVLVNVEVDDVDEVHRRMIVEGGLPELLSLRSEAFGQRHFITLAPGDVMVDVITEIPPTAEYAEAFS